MSAPPATAKVAQGPLSGPAAVPPRHGFDVAAMMFEERGSGAGQKKSVFLCLRRGQNSRRWKGRRAGEQALRYHAGSCLMPFASHDLFTSAFFTASGFLSITVK